MHPLEFGMQGLTDLLAEQNRGSRDTEKMVRLKEACVTGYMYVNKLNKQINVYIIIYILNESSIESSYKSHT